MDGFAVHADEVPGTLRVVGESAAGAPFVGVVRAGEGGDLQRCVVPDGTDRMARWRCICIGGWVRVDAPVTAVNISARRETTCRRPSCCCARARVSGRPRSGRSPLSDWTRHGHGGPASRSWRREVSWGPGQALRPGEIYDSNGPMLRVALRSAGVDVTEIPVAVDTVAAHREALAQALEHDVVISTGGVSVGPHDLVRQVERQLGVTEVFWRVAMRPGKPVTFGTHERSLVFGLPGNPVSTLVCFELFVRPALMALQGDRRGTPAFLSGRLATSVARNAERDDLVRVRVAATSGGRDAEPLLEPLAGQQSHQIATTALADGLARIPRGSGAMEAGERVSFLPLRGG